jgi:AraC-like DNA-binding protein
VAVSIESSALDLASVAEPERAAVWMRSAGKLFPGLSVSKPPVNPVIGRIEGVSLGPGHLWTILSPRVRVSYLPRHDSPPMFSVMLQLDGTTTAAQCGRECTLSAGDFCVIDGLVPFDLDAAAPLSRVVFLQMPRHAALSRRDGLERRTAQAFDTREPGSALLRNVLTNLVEAAPVLEPEQRTAALASVVQMLGVPRLPGADVLASRNAERIAATLAFIDAELADPTLTAQRVANAQGLSRRRLDQILATLGTSLSAQIWARRLAQAASDLLDPRFSDRTVTQIAFGVGFEDAAHFTRAFKRRYDCPPRVWRIGGGGGAAPA